VIFNTTGGDHLENRQMRTILFAEIWYSDACKGHLKLPCVETGTESKNKPSVGAIQISFSSYISASDQYSCIKLGLSKCLAKNEMLDELSINKTCCTRFGRPQAAMQR